MKNLRGKDKIKIEGDIVKHESAGGFLFWENPEGKLLVAIIKKTDDGYYMPKGHIKTGETPAEAATRELMEELSISIKPKLIKKVGVTNYSFTLPNDNRNHIKKVHVYVFEVKKKVKILPRKEEGFEIAKWVTISDASRILAFDSKNLQDSEKAYLESR